MTTLPGFDPSSATWLALKKWAEAEIAKMHRDLENPALDARQTDVARGRIFQLRLLLSHAVPRPEIKTGDTPYT